MDCVHPSHRGRWSALNSLSRFTWSGSAFIGGIITDNHSYRYTFVVTAGIYIFSNCLYTPLVYIVPKQRGAMSIPPSPHQEGIDINLVEVKNKCAGFNFSIFVKFRFNFAK